MLNRTCKEVTRLVLEGEDRRLGRVDRLAIWLHLRIICATCPRFARQVRFMRKSLERWRHYRDGEGDADSSGTP